MKHIEQIIMGQAYTLVCPEDAEDRMRQAVQRVDETMVRIRDSGKIRARERIAVLAALNLAFDLIECQQQAQANQPAIAEAAHVPGDNARLQALLQRMEAALTEDGQLL